MGYETMAQMPPILFSGLNNRDSDMMLLDQPYAADLRNVELVPYGALRKRKGIAQVGDNPPDGSGDVHGIATINREVDGQAFILVVRGGRLHEIGIAGSTWTKTDQPMSDAKIRSGETYFADEPTLGNATYKGDSLYIANGVDEPCIFCGDDPALYRASVPIATLDGGASAGDILKVVTSSAHGLEDGDVVTFPPNVDWLVDQDWTDLLNGKSYRVRVVDSTSFNLLKNDLSPARAEGHAWATLSCSSSTVNATYQGIRRWPLGVYDTTNPRPGYPQRWIDPDGTGNTAWQDESVQPDFPSGVAIVGEGTAQRLYAYGFDKDPSRIDYSELGVPYNMLKSDMQAADSGSAPDAPGIDGGFFYCMRGDGDSVVAVREVRGYLVVFKKRSMHIYSGTPGVDFAHRQSLPVGAVSDASVVKVGDDVYFWSNDGPRRLSTTMRYGDLEQFTIAYPIPQTIKSVTDSAVRSIFAIHDVVDGAVMWFVPTSGSSQINTVLVYYYPAPEDAGGRWTIFDGGFAQMNDAAALRNVGGQIQVMYGAGQDGGVYRLASGTVDDLVSAANDDEKKIHAYYITRWMAPASPTVYKRLLFLDTVITDEGPGHFKQYVAFDYESGWHEVTDMVSITGESGAYWGSMVWGSFTWGAAGRAMYRYKAEGVGRIMRIKIEDNSDLTFGVAGAVVDARVKGTR